jgi:hypothetical protein
MTVPPQRDDLTSRPGEIGDVHVDAQRVAAAVLRREGRRVRALATLAMGLWVVAVLLIASVFLPAAAKAKHAAEVLTRSPAAGQPITAQEIADTLAPLMVGVLAVAGIMIGMALVTALLASVCTVALALTIRRFTLRQVSASLADISAQLRQQSAQGPRPGVT